MAYRTPLRVKILAYMRDNPGKTAVEIAHALGFRPERVASQLIIELRKNTVARQHDPLLPKKGYTYTIVNISYEII
jgi:hypothetical protein